MACSFCNANVQVGPTHFFAVCRFTCTLLFSVILFFGLLFIYTFNTIVIAGTVYLLLVPVSAFHFYSISKSKKIEEIEDIEHHEDVL